MSEAETDTKAALFLLRLRWQEPVQGEVALPVRLAPQDDATATSLVAWFQERGDDGDCLPYPELLCASEADRVDGLRAFAEVLAQETRYGETEEAGELYGEPCALLAKVLS